MSKPEHTKFGAVPWPANRTPGRDRDAEEIAKSTPGQFARIGLRRPHAFPRRLRSTKLRAASWTGLPAASIPD